MKKITMLLALAAVMMFAFAGSVAAFDTTRSVDVDATVAEYAAITGSAIIIEDFTGELGDVRIGVCDIGVETNHDVTIQPAVTTQLTDGVDTIATLCNIDGGVYGNPAGAVNQAYLKNAGAVNHIIGAQGTLGAISAQAAGDYVGEITVTVATVIP